MMKLTPTSVSFLLFLALCSCRQSPSSKPSTQLEVQPYSANSLETLASPGEQVAKPPARNGAAHGGQRVVDLNGDGKTDVCTRVGVGIACSLSNGKTFDPPT